MFSDRLMQVDRNCKLLLALAKAIQNPHIQEKLYQKALRVAECRCGPESLDAALVLMEMSEFYHANGREEEGDKAYEQASPILREYAIANPDVLAGVALKAEDTISE